MATLMSVMTTGNVKLMAASSRGPRRATNQVSATLNVIIARMPHIIGTVIARRCAPTGPWVNTGFDAVKYLTLEFRL